MQAGQNDVLRDLVEFLDASPTPYHASREIGARLEAAGFSKLDEPSSRIFQGRSLWPSMRIAASWILRAFSLTTIFGPPAESLSSTPPLPAAVTAGVFPLEAKRGGKTATIDVDPEMNRAVVYYDSLVGEDGDAEILEALAAHRVRIQSAVGRQVRAKKTPVLSFKPDEVIRAAERIERILHDTATLPERPPEPEPADGEA